MSKILKDIEIPLSSDTLAEGIESYLNTHVKSWGEYRILRQSVDARRRHSPHFVCTLEVSDKSETLVVPEIKLDKVPSKKSAAPSPVIIGSGPAGLFAALRFVERGIPCRLFERGSQSTERIKGINKFWRYGELDPRNNVCYGEGGAGLYSDGKLITRIKSDHIPYVLDRLVQFGAPAEIRYLSNPHVGSDRIRRVIPKLREYLISESCEIFYDTQVTEILSEKLPTDKIQAGTNQKSRITGIKTEHGKIHECSDVILATGHSAEDILYHLHDSGVHLEGKSYALGLRVEHPQQLINKIQYRDFAGDPKLGSANYKLTYHDSNEDYGVYSFCMCPGGYVLSSGTEKHKLVCNGMSNYKRNSPFANSAIVVTIDHPKNFGTDVLAGLKYREQIEMKAFDAVQKAGGTKELPAQRLVDFINRKKSATLPAKHSCPSGVISVNFHEILPKDVCQRLIAGLKSFERSMVDYLNEEAMFFGVETRTSCPIRVSRDTSSLQSLSHEGLYPCGEGAGYAGGITSAACDGVKLAEKIIERRFY